MIEGLTVHESRYLERTVSKTIRNRIDPIWIKAFQLYNKQNPPIGMSCAPCYLKVTRFHIKQNKMTVAHRTDTKEAK